MDSNENSNPEETTSVELEIVGDEKEASNEDQKLIMDVENEISCKMAVNEQDASVKYKCMKGYGVPETTWFAMKDDWGMELPTLILSIVSGSHDTPLDGIVKHSVEDGLAKIIEGTDTWLLTGPFPTAVTRMASKMFSKNLDRKVSIAKNACIGIVPVALSITQERLDDDHKENVGEQENIYSRDYKFDDYHTHWIQLVDGFESVDKFKTDRIFRGKFETYLKNHGDVHATPVINILVHGDYSACMQIIEKLRSTPKAALVVVKGSGSLADVIADAMMSYKDMNKKGLALLLHLEKLIAKKILNEPAHALPKMKGAIKDMVEKHSKQVIIYDPRGDPFGLHRAVIEACKSLPELNVDIFKMLQLAIDFGEIDTVANISQSSQKDISSDLQDLFCYSVENEKAKFVAHMLSVGVNLSRFLQTKHETLCVNKLKHDGTFKILFENTTAEQLDEEVKFDLKAVDELLQEVMEGDYISCYARELEIELQPAGEKKKIGLTPVQKLIIWSIFNNMQELVDCFWKYETNKAVENAIVIFRIAQALSKDSRFDEETRSSFQMLSQKYEQRAVDVLSFFNKRDNEASVDVIKSFLPVWGDKHLITVAANGGSRDFVAHTCCQQYLMDVWKGETDDEENAEKSKKMPREKHGKLRNGLKFLFTVPRGKLLLHEIIFTIFLGCFAFLVLVQKGKYHDSLLYIVFTIVTSLTIDEIREITEVRKQTVCLKLKEWYSSVWNRLDMVAMVLFYTGFCFTFSHFHTAERTILALDLVLWIIKFAQFYRMFYSLGPYLIMIYKMMFHMVGFILVLVIAVVAYGIFMHTMLFPNVTVSWKILFKVLFRPYLLVFGELGVDNYTLSKDATVYGTQKISESTEIIVVIGMCAYLLLANVLLLNMLIAVFNNIYEDIKVNSVKIWRFDKYDMIMEFKNKPKVPIPFSMFENIKRMIFVCRRKKDGTIGKGTYIDTKDFQNRCMWAFHREISQKTTNEESMALVLKRTENMSKDMVELKGRVDNCFEILMKQTPSTQKQPKVFDFLGK